jgi:DNA repair protein RadD
MKFEDLRPHQQKAIQMLRKEWKVKRTHQVSAPVAFGKTATAAYLAKSFSDRGKRVLFVAPYTILVTQTSDRFQEYGLDKPGIIWRDHPDYNPNAMVQIASADTLIRRDFPENIDLMIVDENHIRRIKLLEIIENADFPVVGLSGTPFTPWLGKYYDNFVKPCTMRELINSGYLSEYDFYAPIKPDVTGVKVTNTAGFGMDYKEQEVAEIMGDAKIVGNIVQNWLENGEDRPTIAFCCNVAHANHITNGFNSAGVACEVMTAKTPHEERQEIIGRYELGITKIICNVGVLVAGFDSDVRCIIYARPTKSEIRWVQCIGRGLRTAPGKDVCIVFDHSGTVHRLGYPDQIEYDELKSDKDGKDKAEQIRQEIEKLEKSPKECPKCKFMKPVGSPQCPKCGFKPLGGEDVETDETRQIQKLKQKLEKSEIPELDRQAFYSELLGYAREMTAKGKHYSEGWAAHKYKAKFGTWPNKQQKFPSPPSIQMRSWIKSQQIRYAKSRTKK